jgi:hypothetical protein
VRWIPIVALTLLALLLGMSVAFNVHLYLLVQEQRVLMREAADVLAAWVRQSEEWDRLQSDCKAAEQKEPAETKPSAPANLRIVPGI